MTAQLDDLKNVHHDVMGVVNDEGEIVGGLKNEYANFTKSLRDYDTSQRSVHSELRNQIEGLLPGATSAGLGSAFKEQRERYADPIKRFGLIFYTAIGLLFLVGLSTFVTYDSVNKLDFGLPQSLSALIASSVSRSIVAIPLVWLAYFATKRRNENKRLEEEYAHKETIARAYFNFRQQIEVLGHENAGAQAAQLLEAAIMAVSYNASKSLDKDHDDKLPDVDQIRNLEKMVTGVSKILKTNT